MSFERNDRRRAFVIAAFALVLGVQVFLGVWGIADQWTRGHNGWNGAAYHNGARNTLRWDELFPLQYETANTPPKSDQLYTHAPLGLHLNNVVSLVVFGDREASIRLVAAFWSVAALCMLFAVVRRLWGDAHGLLAATVYVALPINAIYTNMANHSAGFIFWSLLALYLYVRSRSENEWSRPAFVVFLLSFWAATTWDWPAYYIGFCIAAHWVVTRKPGEAGKLGVFCIWTVALFAGHLLLVEGLTGALDELTGTFNARRALSWTRFRVHLLVVPELMFTWTVLAVCAAWIVTWGFRAARGGSASRDLIPIAFLFAGLVHYLTFRWSAVVHSYWAWPLLPFVTIAVATSAIALAYWIRQRLERITPKSAHRLVGIGAASIAALLLVPLLMRDAQIVPEGRRAGGSMWFFTPVRGAIDVYDSGRSELRLAKQVHDWTTRDTGVQLHPSMKSRHLEPRFDITLDRATHRWSPRPRAHIKNNKGVDGWVFLAPVAEFTEEQRCEFATQHPYKQYGNYFLLDLRSTKPDIEVWESAPAKVTPTWWLFRSPFEPPVTMARAPAKEALLQSETSRQ